MTGSIFGSAGSIFGTGSVLSSIFGGGAAFSPLSLFAGGEPGAWYDPSDISTLFKDAAGTQPVTAPGDVVGLMLDKSGNGNHATQSGATSIRPIYGIVPQTGRRNLLTYTEDLANAAWTKTGTTISANKIVEDTSNGPHSVHAASASFPAGTYTASAYAKPAERSWVQLSGILGGNAFGCFFNLTGAGTVGTASTGTTGSIEALPDGSYRISVTKTFAAPPAAGSTAVYLATGNGTVGYTGVAGSGAYVWGVQLETGSAATAYQRVVSQYDVTEAGVPSLHYLAFDGIDDWMQTGTITPGTDKTQIFAGVRKLSDAAIGLIAELSNAVGSYPGSFALFAPGVAAANYMWRNRGSAFQVDASYTNALVAAPVSNVITGIGDISGDIAQVRVDGTQVASSTTDQGTGNYGNYPLYIGRRAGASLPLNGWLYGLIVRFGPTLTDVQISNAERWMARKTGVTI